MKKCNVILYPITEEAYPYIEFYDLNDSIRCVYCCVSGDMCTNKIIFENGKVVRLFNLLDCMENNNFDKIVILNSLIGFDFKSTIVPYIKDIKKCGKTLVFSKSPQYNEIEILREYAIVYEVYNKSIIYEPSDIDVHKRLFSIKTPIIFVLGMYEYTDKMSILLYIHSFLHKAGYSVKTVLTKENAIGFNNCISFPHEMLENNLSDTDKIIFFNHFIRKVEINGNPDVIVIGIPGEILPLNEKHYGHYGLMPFLIGTAIKADYAILNVFGNFCNGEFIQMLNDVCKNRYLIDINAVSISSMVLDLTSLNTDELEVYRFLDSDVVLNDKFFYKRVNINKHSLGEEIINTLSDYGDYNTI